MVSVSATPHDNVWMTTLTVHMCMVCVCVFGGGGKSIIASLLLSLVCLAYYVRTCVRSCSHAESMYMDMSRRKKPRKPGIFGGSNDTKKATIIGVPQDFRRVSSIVDADLLPDTVRRVKLLKHSSDRPLGFYIRDGTSVRVTPYGLEKVPGIFISRLVPGGLAEGTGLLAVNDEILEVNGIEVQGKTLDQVTDMMVANSQNLIITVKPASLPPSTPRTLPGKRSSSSMRPIQPTPLSTSVQKAPPPQNAADSLLNKKYSSRSQGDLPSATSPSPTQGQSEGMTKKMPSSSDLLAPESNGVKEGVTLSQPESVNY